MMQQKQTRADVISEALDCYRVRTVVEEDTAPLSYNVVKERIDKIVKDGKPIILEIKDAYSVQTSMVILEESYDRWAKGYSTCYYDGEEVKVPYTIHYSDILCKRVGVKTIVKGMNPIG
ncbi:hypothetical protein ANTHONY_192 [Bacillus phage Anthony]|uniref:Uncharacterized protein n=4 Tax=Bastillevirus TaxID=1918010 RepID=A0A223LG07_9CAUD|nr:hypothetical protein ANTHONY_192 [Bacillus phage Anthony]